MDQHVGDHHPNSHSVTSSWSSDNPAPHHDGNFSHGGGFSGNGQYNHHRRHHHSNHHLHHHNNFSEPNDSSVRGGEIVSSNSLPQPGRKRPFFHSTPPDYGDGGSFVKLYVRGVPREVTEQDIWSLFGNHGNIVEVVLLKDKRTGQQQESCFVKYAKIEEADRAIGALHNQHTFPGGMHPIEVKYAAGEKERLGLLGTQQSKVYVCCMNKQASKEEIAEIFSPYGRVQEVFLLRDEQKQNRGMGFIQFSHRDMAVAAISVLNGTYVMKGCDQPLIVRFADPKKPKNEEPRATPYFNDPVSQPLLPNASHMSSETGREPPIVSSTSPAVPTSTEMADPPDCDWSEHICPDGFTYYYNCVTCESRWKKPKEYSFHEQQLQKWGQRHHHPWRHPHSLSDPQVPSTQHAPQIQQLQLQT